MKSMVLINCDPSKEYDIKNTLMGMNLNVFECTGAYTFVIEVEGDSPEAVRHFIVEQVRRIKGLRSTLTLAVSSSWSAE